MKVKANALRITTEAGLKTSGFFRKVFRTLPFVFAAAALLGIILSSIQISLLTEPQYDQFAAERWEGDTGKSYRQVSVISRGQHRTDGAPPLFLDAGSSLNKNSVIEIRGALDTLISASAIQGDRTIQPTIPAEPSDIRTWVDAYYSEARMSIRAIVNETEMSETVNSEVTGVAGNNYLFHPRRILSGSFLSEERFDHQSIVLYEQLAWLLFKSNDIEGRTVLIGSRKYNVVGVVAEPDAKIDIAAGFDSPRAYIYFDELAFIGASPSDNGSFTDRENFDFMPGKGEGEITADSLLVFCYEAVLPDPIDGIALNDLKDALTTYSPNDENFYFVDHTGRFGVISLAKHLFSNDEDLILRSKYAYPPSEISAQITEKHLTSWWIVLLIATLFAIISALASVLTILRLRSDSSKSGNPDLTVTEEEPQPTIAKGSVPIIRRV